MHIPKTGGITFHALIRHQYLSEKRFTIITKKDVIAWEKMPDPEKLKYGVVKGHFWWHGTGFHPAGGTYYTFLREPERRFISHYYHVLGHKEGRAKKVFGKDHFTLKQLIRSGEFLNFDNCMVRYLSGAIGQPWDTINDSHLQLAIKNFDEHFKTFGIVEKYDESLLLLQYELGWDRPYYIRLNEGKKTEVVEDFDTETKELIKHFTRFDKLLWEHGKKKFEDKLIQYSTKLKQDLEIFRSENKKNIFLRKLRHVLKGKNAIR